MGLAAAGLVAMLMPAAGFFAKISSGFIAERVGKRNSISGAILLSGVFIFTLTKVSGQGLTSVNFIALGLVLYSFSPTIYASVTSGLPTELKSMGLGAVTMAGNIFGAFSASLIGYLIDTLGYQIALTMIASTVISATALIYVVMREDST
jgi:nitrate/nitrite transporter NarK